MCDANPPKEVVIAGLTHDLPGVPFPSHFKNTEAQFYKETYRAALKVDPELANLMQTGMIKWGRPGGTRRFV